MPLLAIVFVLIAAVCHAAWNFLLKKVEDKQLVTWWAIMVGVLAALPLILPHAALPTTIWPYLLASAATETIYYLALIHAYEKADFSLIYPFARGAAPVFITLWSIIFLDETPAPAGLAGIALIRCGMVIVGQGQASPPGQRVRARDVLLAVFVAALISIYSVIDAAAVRQMAPLPYLMLVFALSGIFLTPFVLKRYGWRVMAAQGRKSALHIGVIAVLMPLGYTLVLKAYAFAQASYIGAIREMSIVFAALAGWRWLGEGFGGRRTAGALLMVAGILIIALAG